MTDPLDPTKADQILALYEEMESLSERLDADHAYISNEDHGTDMVFEFHHDHD